MDLRHNLGLLSFLLETMILPIYLATERCPNCLDGDCQGSGECTKGCNDGFAEFDCQHKCQSTCKDAKCKMDKCSGKIICPSGCKDGYCGQQCKAPCVVGCRKCDIHSCTCPLCNGSFYGDKCQHSCLDRCLSCDNKGQCMSCTDGLCGRNCDKKCGTKCKRCKLETGTCMTCLLGFHRDLCDEVSTEKTTEVENTQPDASDWKSPLIVVIAVMVVLILVAGSLLYKYMNGRINDMSAEFLQRSTTAVQPHEIDSLVTRGQSPRDDCEDEGSGSTRL